MQADFSCSGRFAVHKSFVVLCWHVQQRSVMGFAITPSGLNCCHREANLRYKMACSAKASQAPV